MDVRYAVSLVLNAHLPYVKEYVDPPRSYPHSSGETVLPDQPSTAEQAVGTEAAAETEEFFEKVELPEKGAAAGLSLIPETVEESWFFESLSETYLPLLEVFDRLENDHIPFRVGLSLSPILAQMLNDEQLLKKYTAYLDHQIDFGKQELERLRCQAHLYSLAQHYYDRIIDRRAAFTVRYEGNIFRALDYYRGKGKIEFLAAPATNAFLPFFCQFPESLRAQIETALSYYRYSLGVYPQGFWLPELGWAKDLDSFLHSYGFSFTIADSHGFTFGDPPPSQGSFYPIKTPEGFFVLARDFCACADIDEMSKDGPYRDNSRDIGYELPTGKPGPFLARNGARYQTGYKYWRASETDAFYDPAAAQAAAREHARTFLENCCSRLENASQQMGEMPLSLCAFNADNFGRNWYEGPQFLEAVFRLSVGYRDLSFMTPSEYLCRQPISAFEVSTPEFSSWGDNGYAGVWLDSSNDWIYRHLNRSMDRMVELADRFSGNSSLKERALNQAAREVLLAQSSDWSAFLYRQECTKHARYQVEDALRNFTTIYESLGSNYISTEWLTRLERRHNIFPNINYRVFKRKR
jgi:1,4-alpha-glucan branching enzyme